MQTMYYRPSTGFYARKENWLKTLQNIEGMTPEEALSMKVENGELEPF